MAHKIPPHHLYDLVVTCENGIINRTQEINEGRGTLCLWNAPPEELGRPLRIELVSRRQGLPPLAMDIPEGAAAYSRIDFVGKIHNDDVTPNSGFWWIGHKTSNLATVMGIDLANGEVTDTTEQTIE